MENILNNKKMMIIPVILASLFTIYLGMNVNGPLSWDVYTHINYAWAYIINGITMTDPLLNAPVGKSIGYSPLFHLILIVSSKLFATDMVNAAKLLQPILALLCSLSVVGVAYKIYDDELTALLSGMILLSSFMFTRMMLPIPETVALIFFTWGVYFYYSSIKKHSYTRALLSGIMALLILSVHFSTFVYYMIIITCLMIVELVAKMKFEALSKYVTLIIPVILAGIIGYVILSAISTNSLLVLLDGIKSIIHDPMSLFMGQKAMGLERYIKCVGILPLVLAIIGLYFSFKNSDKRLIVWWALFSFIVSNMHWFGIPVYTYRLLVYFVIPLVMLAGYGAAELVRKFEDKKTQYILVAVIMVLSCVLCIYHLSDPSVTTSNVVTAQSTVQIAPPTHDEQEVIDWFKGVNNTNKSVLTNNLFFGTVLSSSDMIPLHYSYDVYANPQSSKSSYDRLNEENIGYIVYDKSLVMNNTTEYSGTPQIEFVEADYYPFYYYTKEITEDNFYSIKLSATNKVFENNRFIICEVI